MGRSLAIRPTSPTRGNLRDVITDIGESAGNGHRVSGVETFLRFHESSSGESPAPFTIYRRKDENGPAAAGLVGGHQKVQCGFGDLLQILNERC